MFNIGIIGAGNFADQHAAAIHQLSNARLVAASRTSQEALDAFVTKHGCRGYTNYQELLADKQVDIVLIATPHHQHTEIAVQTAQARKHILLEKPMALTLPDCDRIIAAAAKYGSRLMVGHVNHFVPIYQEAKKVLTSGALGRVVHGYSTKTKQWMTPARKAWHLSSTTGGGMWLAIGVHVVDQLAWLIDSTIVQVSGSVQSCFHTQDADDMGVALLTFDNGSTGLATAIGFKHGVRNFYTELICEKGMLKIDQASGAFISKNEQWDLIKPVHTAWQHQALYNEWQAFLTAIKNDTEMPVSGEYARSVMQAVLSVQA